MSEELKLCPWCGHAPDVNNDASFCFTDGVKYGALRCCVTGPEVRTDYKDVSHWKAAAIAAWNDRTPPAPVEGQALPPLLTADELAALRRFQECADDGEGYDVPKAMMQRLAEIGAVQRRSGAYYQATAFGMYLLDPAAQLAQAQQVEPNKRIADALNTTLWLYRRLPTCYGKPPFVDAAIMAFADVLGLEAPAAIEERYRLHVAHQGEKGDGDA